MRRIYLKLALYIICTLSPVHSFAQKIAWQKIDDGLLFAEVVSPVKSDYGDSKITLLKIDPKYFDFRLISAKEKHEDNKSVKEWVKSKGLIAGINGGLFQGDDKTNVGYMKNFSFVNNGHVNKNNTIAAFNRKDATVPEFQIIDLQCQNWNELKDKYNSFSQCIRMIDCSQKSTWSNQPDEFSMAVIATDKHGNALFIFTQSPYSVYNFIKILKLLPLEIYNAMYLEGSVPASFYLNYKGIEVERSGGFDFDLTGSQVKGFASSVPNVIGIVRKK